MRGANRRTVGLSRETAIASVSILLSFLIALSVIKGAHHFGSEVLLPLSGPTAVLLLFWTWNAVREWRQMGRDFQPSVRGSVSTNCLLDIGISRPLPLAGLRCEVTRTREIPAMARIAENVTLDNDGKLLAFGDRTYFNYPAEFKPSDGSTPEPGELCRAHWSVRFKPGGRWVPVGRAVEFNFGATKTRMSEASANFAKPS